MEAADDYAMDDEVPALRALYCVAFAQASGAVFLETIGIGLTLQDLR